MTRTACEADAYSPHDHHLERFSLLDQASPSQLTHANFPRIAFRLERTCVYFRPPIGIVEELASMKRRGTRKKKLVGASVGVLSAFLPCMPLRADALRASSPQVLDLEPFLAPNGITWAAAEESSFRLMFDPNAPALTVAPEVQSLRGRADLPSFSAIHGGIPHASDDAIPVRDAATQPFQD